jgi:predicted Na+-dependent transporter
MYAMDGNSDDLFSFSSGNVALSVLMTAASTLAAVVSKLAFFFFLDELKSL